MGLLSVTDDGVVDATFAPISPRPGGVAMASRSGPLGLALLEVANRTGMGFRAFVSTGDALDVGPIDLLPRVVGGRPPRDDPLAGRALRQPS